MEKGLGEASCCGGTGNAACQRVDGQIVQVTAHELRIELPNSNWEISGFGTSDFVKDEGRVWRETCRDAVVGAEKFSSGGRVSTRSLDTLRSHHRYTSRYPLDHI